MLPAVYKYSSWFNKLLTIFRLCVKKTPYSALYPGDIVRWGAAAMTKKFVTVAKPSPHPSNRIKDLKCMLSPNGLRSDAVVGWGRVVMVKNFLS